MLIALLIMLREGIEAALIVGIVAGFLKQSGHSKLMPKVWFGVVLASLMCLGIGYGIHSATGEIPQKQQEFVVGIIGLVAVAMLTYMILWMKKAARSMKRQLQDSVQTALNHGSGQGWPWSAWRFWPWRAKVWRACFSCLPCSSKARHGLCR
ncbi:integral membrane protein [Neisseria flavescens]|uniref:Ferrous iron permease EfeU family protein n=1 Tax=Neisseria flavescens NRL30031/H210 TaxID=546264 RepID=C0EPG3_NEIFL|nr:ferrous iron permease EfeU family protein [Neisseria flavescens NRL30031/H210]STZ66210.1 integral membrane protein [Neisseria flavescens]